MIRHIVMWKFRRDLEETPEQIALEMKSRLEALVGKIDGLLRAEVGVSPFLTSFTVKYVGS